MTLWAGKIEGIPRISRPSPGTIVLTNGPLRALLPLKRIGGTVFSQYDAEGVSIAGFCTVEFTPTDKSPAVVVEHSPVPVTLDF